MPLESATTMNFSLESLFNKWKLSSYENSLKLSKNGGKAKDVLVKAMTYTSPTATLEAIGSWAANSEQLHACAAR